MLSPDGWANTIRVHTPRITALPTQSGSSLSAANYQYSRGVTMRRRRSVNTVARSVCHFRSLFLSL